MRNDRNEYPTYEEFYHFNVVIATLVTTGRLVQMNFKVDHFQYIFIDECAASTEPEAFIPILGESFILQVSCFANCSSRRFGNGT